MKTTVQQTAHEIGITNIERLLKSPEKNKNMTFYECNNIYESNELSFLKDYSMHPGGLRLTDRAARLAGLRKGMKAADIGCGVGSTAAYLTTRYGLIMAGVDISELLIRIGLGKNPGLNLILHDSKILPFRADSLDAVLFECSMSVMGFKAITLDECAAVLKKDGKLIISDLFSRKETESQSGLPSFSGLESRLAAAGFAVDVSEDHTPALITYGAELSEQLGCRSSAGLFVCSRYAEGFKLSDHCYHLIIARKIKK